MPAGIGCLSRCGKPCGLVGHPRRIRQVTRQMVSSNSPASLLLVVRLRLLSCQACPRGLEVIRLGCPLLGADSSVVAGSWIGWVLY
jgi:hypothetical protein